MDIFEETINLWGNHTQVLMAVEEMAELIDVLMKHHRGRATVQEVANEIADVRIMMEQLSVMFGRHEVNLCEARKIIRLRKLIMKARGKNGNQD